MKGPVPMGSALISTAVQAHSGGMSNTRKARAAVAAGCSSSLPSTSRSTPGPGLAVSVCARNRPMATSAQGLAEAPSSVT